MVLNATKSPKFETLNRKSWNTFTVAFKANVILRMRR